MEYGQNLGIDRQILTSENQFYVSSFNCGKLDIDSYYQEEAAFDQTTVTYLYIDTAADKMIACVTISCSAIFTNDGEIEAHAQFSTILSAMEIKYLAVDTAYQHMPYTPEASRPTLSDILFDDIIWKMYQISHKQIGATKIVLYSVPEAVSFYKRHSFKDFGNTMYGDKGYYVGDCYPMYFDLNT